MDWFSNFHFLRPEWLWSIPVALAVWIWLSLQRKDNAALRGVVAPHLLSHLTTSSGASRWFTPEFMVLPLWLVAAVGAAGPAWRLQPSPFAEDRAGLMIVLRVSESMTTPDLLPTRLERARIKLRALLDKRAGAPTGLVAYSGTAHLVMPMTSDGDVIDQMVQSLSPEIMPEEGDALAKAMSLASSQVNATGDRGSIVVVTDSIAPNQIAATESDDWLTYQLWVPLPDDSSLQVSGIPGFVDGQRAPVKLFTADDADVDTIVTRADVNIAAVDLSDESRWEDGGYWVLPVVVALGLVWCRRGWRIG